MLAKVAKDSSVGVVSPVHDGQDYAVGRPYTLAAPQPVLRCALLNVTATSWFVQLIRVAPGLSFHVPYAKDIALESIPNPYRLLEEDSPDVVMYTSDWFTWLADRHPDRVDTVFARLRASARTVIGLDGSDGFTLAMPPEGMARADIVLKGQGLYLDREMYNYRLGSFFPGANWTSKQLARRRQFTDRDLLKLRVSLPCFAATERHIRARIRALNPGRGPFVRRAAELSDAVAYRTLPFVPLPKSTTPPVHCVGSLTHVQRLEVVESLHELQYPGIQAVTAVPNFLYGTGALIDRTGWAGDWEECDLREPPADEDPEPAVSGAPPTRVSKNNAPVVVAEDVLSTLRDRIASAGLDRRGMRRLQFLSSMARSAIVVAPTGFGELTFRHAEAFVTERALVCQDLRHVETMYPFRDGANVLFCRPDFADLDERLQLLSRDRALLSSVARGGHEAWSQWAGEWRQRLVDGVTRPLHEAVAGVGAV
jgi:hypothetical protein